MKKYIDNLSNIDSIIMLLEILEIKTDNKIIKELQEESAVMLKKILSEATNPSWVINLLLKAREEGRK